MRAVHVAPDLAGPPNLLQLSHTFAARLCRISRLQMTVSTTKLIKRVLQEPVATSGLQRLFLCKQLLGSHDLRVARDLQIPWPPMFLQQKALEIDSRNLIFAWVQERMSHCYSAALYGRVSKTQESVYLQCMRASARCANNYRASKPVAIVTYFCGKTL